MAPPSGTSFGGPSSSGGMNRGNGSAGTVGLELVGERGQAGGQADGLGGRRGGADRQADEAAQDVGQLAALRARGPRSPGWFWNDVGLGSGVNTARRVLPVAAHDVTGADSPADDIRS